MTVRRFAEHTAVPVARSRAEIERLVRLHGATAFASMWAHERFVVGFEMRGRQVRLDVPAPDAKRYRTTARWEQEERRRWRVLLLMLKAKLEMVASGDADFEQEFLSYLVLPGGQTVGQRIIPEIEAAISGRELPPLLPGRSTK